MHIPDGFLSPAVSVAAAVPALAAVALASRKLSKGVSDRLVPRMGVLAAFIFAAQMFNFPIAAGTSGHLMGGVLAAIVAGPAASVIVIFTVLLVQCLFFQDGGIFALGANTLNMAVLGVLAGWGAYFLLNRLGRGNFLSCIAVFVGAWLSVVVASAACAVELYASGVVSLKPAITAMVAVHSIIGIGEAAITLAVYSFLRRVSPILFSRSEAMA